MQSFSHLPPHLIQSRLLGLYVITDGNSADNHLNMANAACQGGAGIVQLRAKNLPLCDALQVAQQIRQMTLAAKVLFIVNDRIDLALAAKADGVHLGDDDIPANIARRIMGRHAVIGVSASTTELADQAVTNGASYIGTGAVFATATKTDAGTPIGLEQLRKITDHSKLPIAAIGGVDSSNIQSIIDHGAQMACVISAISKAPSRNEMTKRVIELAKYF
jgi:thiamine-phosphate pyrophosphorylase